MREGRLNVVARSPGGDDLFDRLAVAGTVRADNRAAQVGRRQKFADGLLQARGGYLVDAGEIVSDGAAAVGKLTPSIAQGHFIDLVARVIEVAAVAIKHVIEFIPSDFSGVQLS